eukprot:CAMPEP_0171276380 /NCGR_PEP_ID=MMETSP0790-20130122/63808_1 /TAXON_ID=2925 /ORGANISM="Alexandrium catenella, Strain OF101" /LENGTH=249 /DNA_ID=CAMNT_0011745473 /DNA_START=27 /DNA_END=774 /DNA_ORIENTATION=+
MAAVLLGAELPDWCLLAQVSRWARDATWSAEPVLRSAICDGQHGRPSPLELCRALDVTGLWAVLGEEPALADLKDPDSEETLLHVALRASSKKGARGQALAWLLSRPSALAAARTRARLRAASPRGDHGEGPEAEGVDVDARDDYEATPLIDAVREESPGVVGMLLAARADPNAFVPNCHGHGDTPLILAVRLRNLRIVKQLLSAPGIDLHRKTLIGVPFGKEALDFAPEPGPLRDAIEAAIAAEHRGA